MRPPLIRNKFRLVAKDSEYLTLTGFKWREEALVMSKSWCDYVDSSICFTEEGCTLWARENIMCWIDAKHYVLYPCSRKRKMRGTNFINTVLAHILNGYKRERGKLLIQTCGDTLCMNPAHLMQVTVPIDPWEYIDTIEIGTRPRGSFSFWSLNR